MNSTFEAERISLRPFDSEDQRALLEYLNQPELEGRRYIPLEIADVPLTAVQISDILSKWAKTRRQLHLGILKTDDVELIGHTSVFWGWDSHCPDVQLVIDPRHQRQGYGSEVLSVLMTWIFRSLPAHNVSCWIADWNVAGQSFLRNYGFESAGASRREEYWRGKYVDIVSMEILRPDWEKKHGP